MDFTGGSAGKESACNAGVLGSIPVLGRYPGKGKGYPLQYSGLENSMAVQSMTSQRVRATFTHSLTHTCFWGFPSGSDGKASVCNTGDLGLIPKLGRSPGEGNGSQLQYSCLENPMDPEPAKLLSMGSQRVEHD